MYDEIDHYRSEEMDMNKITTPKKSRGRPSSFKREDMVESVMQLFWERGYKDLSFNEIAKETGLTRASLYNAFSTKENLLLETMEHYARKAPDKVLHNVGKDDLIGPIFYALFNQASKERAGDKKHRGCLIINCINELISNESSLGSALTGMYNDRKHTMEQLIEQAIKQKELPEDSDSKIMANLMITFLSGFNTSSKTGMSEKELRTLSHTFLNNFGFSAS